MGDLCLRREASHPGCLGACLQVEVCGVSDASVAIRGKRAGATLKALERSLESRGLAPARRRAEPRPPQTMKTRPASGPFGSRPVVFGPAADSDLAGTDLGDLGPCSADRAPLRPGPAATGPGRSWRRRELLPKTRPPSAR